MLISVPLLAPHKKMHEPELCLQVKYVIGFEFKKQSVKISCRSPGTKSPLASIVLFCFVFNLLFFFLTECLGPCMIFPKEKSTSPCANLYDLP